MNTENYIKQSHVLNVMRKWKCWTEYKFDVVITIVTGYVLMTNI